ncbi:MULTISPECIES: hypothetical protein [Saccharopolyspora]|uniref:Asp23/Gls24 family envelope stress response protein n=1 Tax=Saccharopolyspora cebuensis TaxID=418759 RepID=A0ABV4CBQ6_9PSEU
MAEPDSTAIRSGARTEPADEISRVVLAHPAVARMHPGRFGETATPLPGRRVDGVRLREDGGVEVSVVVRLGPPLPEIIGELRTAIGSTTGAMPVDITIADVVTD